MWRIALPRPGSEDQLFELIADLMARRLDRGRPLWEVWVIEGLADSKWAILTKLHHCMADGIAATHLLAGLSDESMSDSFASNIHDHAVAIRICAAGEAAHENVHSSDR